MSSKLETGGGSNRSRVTAKRSTSKKAPSSEAMIRANSITGSKSGEGGSNRLVNQHSDVSKMTGDLLSPKNGNEDSK